MAYTKTNWTERITQFTRRFTTTNINSNTIELTPVEGTVTQAGVALSPTNLNKMEQGIYDAHQDIATLNNTTIVSVATPNKVLKLDANSKLPTSITGDANTIDGYHAGNSNGQVPVSNGTLCTNLNAQYFNGHPWSDVYTAINAGDVPIIYDFNSVFGESTTYTVNPNFNWVIGFPANSLRIQFNLYNSNTYTSYCKITKNGVAVGTERTKSGNSQATFVEDIPNWQPGDVLGLMLKTSNVAGTAYALKIKVSVDKAPGIYDKPSW